MKMRYHSALRLALSGLLAAVLLTALAVVPVSAANTNDATVLYSYEGAAGSNGRSEFLAAFPSNEINETSSPGNATPVYTGTIHTADGDREIACTGWYLSMAPERYNVGSLHYGLPYEVLEGNYKKMTESLKFELNDLPYPIATAGIEALNLDLRYLYRQGNNSSNPVFERELQVFVSLDGENYLPGSVGIRSAKLLGGGIMNVPSNAKALLYDIQTENLLDIPGLKPGDRIRKIMIRPHGSGARTYGYLHIQGVTLSSFVTKADFDRLVPAEEIPTAKLDPKTIRQMVIDEGLRVANTRWTSGSTVYIALAPSSTAAADAKTTYRNYPANMLYSGPVYARVFNATRELFQAGIVDGKHMNGYSTDNVYGMDCQTFVWNAISRVSRTIAWACMNTPGASRTIMLGSDFLKTLPPVHYTDHDVVTQNSAQDMYRQYALADMGDILVTYRTNGSTPHTRLVRENHVERNADGTINPTKSYVNCTEQRGAVLHYVRLADGTELEVERDDFEKYSKQHPDAQILYTHNAYASFPYTYQELQAGAYVAYTLDEYRTGEIELEKVDFVITSKAQPEPLQDAGAFITFSSNYRIIGYRVKVEDRNTGAVVFQDSVLNENNRLLTEVYTSDALDARLNALPNGDWRLSVSVDSGPFTAIGQSAVPTTTANYDFTVTGRTKSDSVKLDMPPSVSAGQDLSVRAVSSVPFDAADVEVKFDESKLTYVGAADAADQLVRQDGGLVRVMRLDARSSGGTVVTLKFKAKTDAELADAVLLKRAYLSTADKANTDDLARAAVGGTPDASMGMKDVMPAHWYHDAVNYVLENGVMSGYSANTFGPDNTLTRAMVVQVLYNKENKPASNAANPFKDIAGDQWYFNAVRWGADKGVVAGYGGGVFKPDDNVTIEQVAVILHNYAGKPASGGDAASLGAHSDWAAPALGWAAEKGILKDLPYDAVTGPATRAQTAQMLMNFLKNT